MLEDEFKQQKQDVMNEIRDINLKMVGINREKLSFLTNNARHKKEEIKKRQRKQRRNKKSSMSLRSCGREDKRNHTTLSQETGRKSYLLNY